MKKTYTESCDFIITIKGNYSNCNLYTEELGISTDDIWDYVTNNIAYYYQNANIEITNKEIEEE